MSKIDSTGAGGPRPISNPEPPDTSKETSTAKESAEATVSKPVPGDKNAIGDLKAAGNLLKAQLQSQLHKELETKKATDVDKEKEMALQVAQNMSRFAPPYVPVGPVVIGDNTLTPEQAAAAASGKMKELNLRADQFQINDQGNLIITNEKLIEFFKTLKDTPGGQDVRLGIMKMKPSGEE